MDKISSLLGWRLECLCLIQTTSHYSIIKMWLSNLPFVNFNNGSIHFTNVKVNFKTMLIFVFSDVPILLTISRNWSKLPRFPAVNV